MTRVWNIATAREIVDRLGVDLDIVKDDSIDQIVEWVAGIDYGDEHASETDLGDLRRALTILRDE
jgi:hypothetical protein